MAEGEKLLQIKNAGEQVNSSLDEIPMIDVPTAVRQQLENLHRAGLTHLPIGTIEYTFDWTQDRSQLTSTSQSAKSEPTLSTNEPSATSAGSVRESASTTSEYQKAAELNPASVKDRPTSFVPSELWGSSLPLAERKTALKVLQDEIATCTKCDELSSKRAQTVFGIGNPAARLVFVGEAPGAQEDREGQPFVGEAGQLLDKIMGACKLTRDDVFILNTVKCRPPGNRNPVQNELANCWGYAERQLEILQPEFICCLGSVAARTLLKTTQSLGRLRKQFHAYRGSRVLVTYHPAYLLRTPSAKRHVWDDMKMLMQEMGVDLSN